MRDRYKNTIFQVADLIVCCGINLSSCLHLQIWPSEKTQQETEPQQTTQQLL